MYSIDVLLFGRGHQLFLLLPACRGEGICVGWKSPWDWFVYSLTVIAGMIAEGTYSLITVKMTFGHWVFSTFQSFSSSESFSLCTEISTSGCSQRSDL